jgi:hypothetical protein
MAPRSHDTIRRFEPMSRLADFKVDRGFTDPRGWKVLDGEGQALGTAKDLIIDTDRMVAAYVDVELEAKIFDSRTDRHILVPKRDADRDGDARRLIVPALARSRVAALRAARAEHDMQFWEHWWQGDGTVTDLATDDASDSYIRPVPEDSPYGRDAQLDPAPGSHAPPGTERVERRDVHGNDSVVAWHADDERDRRRIDE